MSSWLSRSYVAVHVTSIGLLVLAVAKARPLTTLWQNGQISFLAVLFLGIVFLGFSLKLLRGWPTRFLWEWMFISALFLGGWIIPRAILPGIWGSLLGALIVCSPWFSLHAALRLGVFLVSAGGAAIVIAGYIPRDPLWILWGGLMVYDLWLHERFHKLVDTLSALGKERRTLTLMPVEEEGIAILPSHVILPTALITQAAWQSFGHGWILLFALLIGAWYAMMRPVQGRTLTILPWTFIWMAASELLIKIVQRFV